MRFLKLSEFQTVLPFFKDPVSRALAVTLFSSGARLGEALALTEMDYSPGKLLINKQLTRNKTIAAPKRNKIGTAKLLEVDLQEVLLWLKYPAKDSYRDIFARDLRRACMSAFSKDTAKWLSPADLRHSYAKESLRFGVSVPTVAESMRNTTSVIQRYYADNKDRQVPAEHMNSIIEGLNSIDNLKSIA